MTSSSRRREQILDSFGRARVLLLGIGGLHGRDYKLNIARRLREQVAKLVVVEVKEHWADEILRSEIKVDDTILLPNDHSLTQNVKHVMNHLETTEFFPDAIVTYRQEWLMLRASLALEYSVPGPSKIAVEVAGNKFKTKALLKSLGFEVPTFEVVRYEDLQARRSFRKYPFFIRPTVGIRSEWARAISNIQDFREYTADIMRSGEFAESQTFLIESLLVGHEVDVDLFMNAGKVIYARASDNFPVRWPYSLETGHLMPSILPRGVQQKLVDVASRASLACGFTAGNIHAELIVLPDERVFVVEINGRLGGMYIADWHHQVWGVDLILAELAVSLNQSPEEFIQVKDQGLALAQLCLCASPARDRGIVSRSVYFDYTKYGNHLEPGVAIEGWYSESQEESLPMCGPLNLGAITVSGRNALGAFEALADVASKHHIEIRVGEKYEEADLRILNQFCLHSPMQRYRIRKLKSSDFMNLKKLLKILTTNANSATHETLNKDPNTKVLCVEDKLCQNDKIIATISVHFWKRIRPGSGWCAYLHDLVVLPEYRGLGLAHQLVNAAVELARSKRCYKAYLDCDDEKLRNFYKGHGFAVVGDCMVQYLGNTG